MSRRQEALVTKVWCEIDGKAWPYVPMNLSVKWGL